MSQIVSKESLNALAALAFKSISYEYDSRDTTPGELAMTNIERADEALSDLLCADRGYDMGNPQHSTMVSMFTNGMEFGLAVAAAIVTTGLDLDAAVKAIKVELSNPNRWWPEALNKEAA